MFVPNLPPAPPLVPHDQCLPPPHAGDPHLHGIYHLGPPLPPPPPPPFSYDPLDRWLPSFQGSQPDHRAGCSTPSPSPAGLSAWQLPVHQCASSGAPYGRPRSSRRGQYREHRHRACDEGGRRPRYHSPLKGSLPLQPSPKNRHRAGDESGRSRRFHSPLKGSLPLQPSLKLEDDRKESLPLQPSPKQSRCKSPLERFDSPMKFDASYEVNDLTDSNGKPDPSYDSLVNDFMDAVENNWHETEDLEDDPAEREKMCGEQTKRFAELALRHYNKSKNNKVKYSLVKAIHGNAIFEDTKIYAHVNFSVMAKNGPQKNGPKVLAFAELQHVGNRPNAMALTSFHFLDGKKQLSGRHHLAQNSFSTQDKDKHHCYACTDETKHPDGARYKAGHFVAMSYYYED